MKACTKLRIVIWGFTPGCLYLAVQTWLRARQESYELGWLLAALFVGGPMQLSVLSMAYMLYAQPPFWRQWRHEVLLAHLLLVQLPAFVVLHYRPLYAIDRAYIFEGAFNVVYTLIGEAPLRYTLLVALANMPVNYWMMLDAAGGSWPTQREYWHNAIAVVGMMLVAPLLLHVAWLRPMQPPQRLSGKSLPLRLLLACEGVLLTMERAVATHLSGLSSYHLVAGACYPVLALHVYKNVMGGVSGIGSASPPFEVLVGLFCCGVLATTHQVGTMAALSSQTPAVAWHLGIKLLARLSAAQAVLSDVFPEHINSALGLLMSPANSMGGASTTLSSPDINPRVPVHMRSLKSIKLLPNLRVTKTWDGVMRGSDSMPDTPDSYTAESSHVMAQRHEAVTILFADITGFTSLCDQEMEPVDVMNMLHALYSAYDSETKALNVYKVETIGDCYMACTGLNNFDTEQGEHMLRFAFKMLHIASEVRQPNGQSLKIRVGMHTGSVTSGLVGQIRRRYCLFGDTVNTASRMESSGKPNCIQVSDATYRLVNHMPGIQWQSQLTPVKGKATMMTHMVVEGGWDKTMYA